MKTEIKFFIYTSWFQLRVDPPECSFSTCLLLYMLNYSLELYYIIQYDIIRLILKSVKSYWCLRISIDRLQYPFVFRKM